MTDTVSGSYFASLAKAKYLRLTTFKRKGTPVSAPVPGIVDGDRAYFGAWSRSGTVRRLQHTDGVQVAPCSAMGLVSYGPPLDAAPEAGVLRAARRSVFGRWVGASYESR